MVADLQRRWHGRARAAAAARLVLEREGRPRARLSVALVDDTEMAAIHRFYLGVEGPTDVVSFPLDDAHDDLLGEVVVSTDTAAREAAARSIPLDEEVLRYVVHGTLHLLGYDDHRPADRRRMHARQEELLATALRGRVAQGGPRAYARRLRGRGPAEGGERREAPARGRGGVSHRRRRGKCSG
jgi:probable rRNA maturation factor